MPNTNTVIADRVRGVAAEKRLSQQRVADILSLSRTSVTERYSGRVPFTAPELFTLAGALNVDVARFYPEPVLAA